MAEVLSPTGHFDGMSGYGSNLFLPHDTSSRSSPILDPNTSFSDEFDDTILDRYPSTAPPSPELDRDGQIGSSGFSSVPFGTSFEDDCAIEEDLAFPSYDDGAALNSPRERRSSPPPQRPPLQATPKVLRPTRPRRARTSLETPPSSPTQEGSAKRPLDDSAVKAEPTRHVDYLSHTWKDEDLWSSWRHIVAKRRIYGETSRLENAAWRTWGKSQYGLHTVSPVSLNWMKDHDTTWLYGPLQTGTTIVKYQKSVPETKLLSRSHSFTKPILKKRSASEIMLQQSISSSTLIKQAIATLKSQTSRPRLRGRSTSSSQFSSDRDSSLDPLAPIEAISETSPAAVASSSSSGSSTPSEPRHITFNDKVEQCIAVHKYKNEPVTRYGALIDDDSDDEAVMMRPESGKEQKLGHVNGNALRNSFCSEETKTIAKLPATTLKYWHNEPETIEQEASSPKSESWEDGTKMVHSSSQETLKPTDFSSNFLMDEDDVEDEDDSWKVPRFQKETRRDSLFVHRSRTMRDLDEDDEEDYDLDYTEERYAASARKDFEKESFNIHKSMQHTPVRHRDYEEDEDDIMAQGLFGKVIDTVNTARDIAHVIWNVGWQK